MELVRIFQVISGKFNIARICKGEVAAMLN